MRKGRFGAAVGCAVAVTLLAAGSGAATDSFTPSTLAVSAAAGGSASVPESFQLDPLPPKADILLALDTTGSMGGPGGALGNARSDATAIVNTLASDFAASKGTVKFAVADFQDYYPQFSGTSTDTPYRLDQPLTTAAAAVQAAVNSVPSGDGGDLPESYFRVFYEASTFAWEPDAKRFLIVLGDQTGHDPVQQSTYPDCPNNASVDPGSPTSGTLPAATAVQDLVTAHVTLSFVTYQTASGVLPACHAELAAPTGGSDVVAGATGTLAAQIESLVQAAARKVSSLQVTATTSAGGNAVDPTADPGSWVHVTGLPSSADVTNPITFTATVTPPANAVPGTYSVDLGVRADGTVRGATQTLTITVKQPLSNLSVSVNPGTVGAGIDQVPVGGIPSGWLAYYAGTTTSPPIASAPIGSSPIGSSPIGSSPIGSSAIGSSPIGSSPIGSSPIGSSPIGSSGILDLPIGSSPIGSSPLTTVLLSQIPVTPGWDSILCGTLVGKPLDTLTLADLPNGDCGSGTTSLNRFKALSFQQADLSGTLFRSLHWASLLLGNVPLGSLPGGLSAWCAPDGSGLVRDGGGDCSGTSAGTTVLGLDLAGHLGSAPIGSSPIGSSPIGSSSLGTLLVSKTAVNTSRLALVPLAGTSGVVTGACSSCVTLGDAATANAIDPNLTFLNNPSFVAAMNAMSPAITVNDVLVAVLGATGFPWEQLPIQGLQPYASHPTRVTYTLAANVDCSVASAFSLTARLPSGFFPVAGTATLSLNGVTALATGAPDVLGRDVGSAAKLNAYRWSLSCGEGNNSATTSATLKFDAYAGLTLGTFPSTATATAGTFSISATGAPVTVNQNGEPNDEPASAQAIQPGTLVVGHIAASGDQDFYSVNLTGVPRGTKIAAYLQVPAGADFDLTISKPAAKSFFSTPIGSSPIGSSPIEDHGVGIDASGQALPSETLQDIPIGSSPIGSSPIGSSPIGSSSTTRGDANEAAMIITAGETGVATIGVSGYNGSSSTTPYVLRVQTTSPPPLPALCPARIFPFGLPSSFPAGALPSSLPTGTKSIFVVDTQQLDGLYGQAATTTLLNALGGQSTAGSFGARPEVTGSVLDVSGSSAVSSAYSAWNAKPCDIDLRNNVVRAINDVVATYRNSAAGLPNLHYVVLLGTDESVPMAASPDPVTLSPELNEASDLAFTTNNLTSDNSLYAVAAQNYVLTDGAYGAFRRIPWLGRDLLLPQISISRLVETPKNMVDQINQYLLQAGSTSTPVEPSAGTLNPTSAAVTGYDFMADGATTMRNNLRANFSGLATLDTLGANPSIAPPHATNPWTATDLNSSIFTAAAPPAILGLNGHYNHYLVEAADSSLSNSGALTATLPGRVVFTMGCHGGLSVPDTLAGVSGAKALDWPQLYGQKGVAAYIGNTGFGYGDSDTVALSERLYALFAKNLHSDGNSIGEEWAQALQQYFATAGAYAVYDEKVLEESTFYGLPFWHFTTSGSSPTFTPLTTVADAVTGTPSATVAFTSASATQSSEFGLYRPTLPLASQEVTSTLPARGVWIKSLVSSDTTTAADIGMPIVDLAAHEPVPNVKPIYFPANPFTLERSIAFGKERDFLNVSDQYRPGAGTQRHFSSGSFEILYSQAPEVVAPLISQVNVSTAASTATVQARVADAGGTVAEVAALVNDGSWHYLQLAKSAADPTLWTGSIAVLTDPEVFVEATDGVNVSYSANKGSNFTSANSAPPNGLQILLQAPTGPYALNQGVSATYQCLVGGSALPAAQCTGSTLNGQPIDTSSFGLHTFLVTATDASGSVIGSLQREFVVQYPFQGFFAPVDNEPVFNTVKAGSGIPVKFSLSGNQGLDIFVDATYPKSQLIACDASAPADGIESTVTAGSSSLSYDAGTDQYTYVWKTDASWAGTCRALILKTKDGLVHRADFKFK